MDIEMMWIPTSDDLRSIKSLHSPCDPGIEMNNGREQALELAADRGNDRGMFAGDGKVNHNSQPIAQTKNAMI